MLGRHTVKSVKETLRRRLRKKAQLYGYQLHTIRKGHKLAIGAKDMRFHPKNE